MTEARTELGVPRTVHGSLGQVRRRANARDARERCCQGQQLPTGAAASGHACSQAYGLCLSTVLSALGFPTVPYSQTDCTGLNLAQHLDAQKIGSSNCI